MPDPLVSKFVDAINAGDKPRRTTWKFFVDGGKITRFETGQA